MSRFFVGSVPVLVWLLLSLTHWDSSESGMKLENVFMWEYRAPSTKCNETMLVLFCRQLSTPIHRCFELVASLFSSFRLSCRCWWERWQSVLVHFHKYWKRMKQKKRGKENKAEQNWNVKWSNEKIFRLIKLYEERPCLWDVFSQQYHNRETTRKAKSELEVSLIVLRSLVRSYKN